MRFDISYLANGSRAYAACTSCEYKRSWYCIATLIMVNPPETTALQNVEVTARWHNIWLGTTVFLLISTALFSGLFGGYFTAYQESKSESADCFLEMHSWKHFEMLDPSIHSVALLNGTYYAVPDHTVTTDSCLLKLSKSLQTHNVILPHLTGVGRALNDQEAKGVRVFKLIKLKQAAGKYIYNQERKTCVEGCRAKYP